MTGIFRAFDCYGKSGDRVGDPKSIVRGTLYYTTVITFVKMRGGFGRVRIFYSIFFFLVKAGTIWCNCWMVRDLRMPFGGMKMSGMGKECQRESLEFYTESKNICVQY